jgi:hypothetical protein
MFRNAELIDSTDKFWRHDGPCRDRTYDQLIKRSRVPADFFHLITNTYTNETVPQFADLRCDKALNS